MHLVKYPRTHHLQGSRFQPGDEDLDSVPFKVVRGHHIVIEEKMDGANSAISFDENGKLFLQSRGHFLTGGEREKHFDLFKQWAHAHTQQLWLVLGARYIAYGEWLFAKHTIFYNLLPHYWLEFDVFDRQTNEFLSTKRRAELWKDAPVSSVKVLFEGELDNIKELARFLGPSSFISKDHLQNLASLCQSPKLSLETALSETDQSTLMEGLYIKVEEDGVVKERFKWIRSSFLSSVAASQSHWLERPVLPNQLKADVNLFEVSE